MLMFWKNKISELFKKNHHHKINVGSMGGIAPCPLKRHCMLRYKKATLTVISAPVNLPSAVNKMS